MMRTDGYEISTDASRLDLDVAYRALSEDSYWARLLATADAHGLYEPFGFGPVARPEHLLERRGATP